MKSRAAALLAFAACSRGNAPAPQQPAQGSCLLVPPPDVWWADPELARKKRPLADGGAIGGYVSDGNAPVGGIQVVITRNTETITMQRTPESGGFYIDGLQPGDYELRFYYGSSIAARKPLTITAGHTSFDVEALQLRRLPRVPRCA